MESSHTSGRDTSSDDPGNDIFLPPFLDHAKIVNLPQTAFYIPNFISETEEQMILDKVRLSKQPNVPLLNVML